MLRLTIKINQRTIYNIEAVRTSSKTITQNGVLVARNEYDVIETVNQFRFKHKGHIQQDGALVLSEALLAKVIEKEAKRK